MRDIDVRRALHADLREVHEPELNETRFLDELGLCGEVRVDVAVLNGSFSGYEIKSAKDNLKRLPKQVDFYSRTLDYAFLVCAENHLVEAMGYLPEWWGVQIAVEKSSGGVSLVGHRSARINPCIQAEYLVQLLWKDEMLEELTLREADRGVRSKPRKDIACRLVDTCTLEELRHIVRLRLKSRVNWRVDE